MKQGKKIKFEDYIDSFVKAMYFPTSSTFYGCVKSSDENLTRLMPYVTYMHKGEIESFAWVHTGEPLSITNSSINAIHPVSEDEINFVINQVNNGLELSRKRRRLEEISVELQIPEMEKEFKRQKNKEKDEQSKI